MTKTDQPELYAALLAIVKSLNNRFPDGKDPFQAVTRLCEEAGELAKAVNHREKTGIKHEKYGPPNDVEFVKEVQDVMVAALNLADHYHLLPELEKSIQDRYQEHAAANFHQI